SPLTSQYPEMTQEEAYAIQRSVMASRRAAGARLVGWKVGLTSKAMQQMFQVDSPDFGQLLDNMVLEDGATISNNVLLQPRIEPEIAFILKRDIKGPGVSAGDVLAATEAVTPALEIIDSRIADWKIRLADTIADNASCGRIVLGKSRISPDKLDLRLVGLVFSRDGEVVSTAAGAAVLGHPANAVAWLANTLGSLGETLAAGHVIMPGSLVGAVNADPGSRYTAEYDHLGSVTVNVA
ncbi:MAG TPA: fumarylacetoacetate hydrolase family protein, partial [Dehalococcoidia bacterium]|nr:fumarylacetoacetate hydrolase family protein [Dehalococcoidia bacterium]